MRRLKPMILALLMMLLLVKLSPTEASSGNTTAEDGETEEIPELRCDIECTCNVVQKIHPQLSVAYDEYTVICNRPAMKNVRMTEVIFGEVDGGGHKTTYVRLEDAAQVTVTQGMIEKWLRFGSSSIDFSRVGRVLLPTVENLKVSPYFNQFAGIGLFDCGLDSFPSGLFTGKPKVGLHLLRSYVGHMSLSEVFRSVTEVQYLKVHDSKIAVLEAGMNSEHFLQIDSKSEVTFNNSVLGTMMPGALKVKSFDYRNILFNNMTLAQFSAESIVLQGRVNLVMENSRVAEMQQKALVALDESSITIRNSALILQPLALNHQPCTHRTHFENNSIIVLSAEIDQTELSEGINSTRVDPMSLVLEMALHKSCVCSNLPPNRRTSCQKTVQTIIINKDNNNNNNNKNNNNNTQNYLMMEYALYTCISVSVIALLIVMILTYYLIRSYKRNRRNKYSEPPVVMSQLQREQEHIYEDADFMLHPPPVPKSICTATLPLHQGNHCGASASDFSANEYMTMGGKF